MYPLLLKPIIKNYIWGGTKLKDEFAFETGEIAAEAWLLTVRSDADNIILNGDYKGKTISEVLKIWCDDAVGKNAAKFDRFPLLIKFIDAHESLSVQVHPDDKYAIENENEYGKTEMWYVVDAEVGSQILCGVKPNTTKEDFSEKVKQNDLQSVGNYIDVKNGDTVLIPAGTVHAIGAGLLIAEVQQNSDVTYRVSDYGRLGADGKPRELHLEKALDVIDFKALAPAVKNITEGNGQLVCTQKFTVDILRINGAEEICNDESFVSLVILSSNAVLKYNNECLDLKKGDSVFVPAGLSVSIVGECEVLKSCV